ncbi:MAG TPA: TonB-dependent receptor [Longimicrobiales bacterium]|nr:TonB-dependent receptor [Longimicrobiales bacterium]
MRPHAALSRDVAGLAALLACWGAAAPLAAQEGAPEPDSAFALAPLTVEIGRARAGAVPLARTPFSSQVVRAEELGPAGSSALAGSLAALPGVTLTSQTGSPAQLDVRVRGFTLSPIVGAPQSVSVFVDGVRVNEADASQVHLSLVPEAAIERVELMRGPVGVFGKNAIAGALNFVTRRAGARPEAELELQGGSFGSAGGSLSASSPLGPLDALVVGTYRHSDGWRRLQASEERSIFAKLGWRGARTDAWLSYTFEADSLEGPGPLPESWIEGGPLPADGGSPPADRRRLQYTGGTGDAFAPTLHFVSGRMERELSARWTLEASGFGRFADFRQRNDNISEPDALGLTRVASLGTSLRALQRRGDRLVLAAGAEWVRHDVDIEIRELPNRNFPDVSPATTERLRTDEHDLGFFGEAWWALTERLALYGSLRWDRVRLPVEDLLDPSDSGESTFSEPSGGVGLSLELRAGLGAFAGYGRGFRAPVILEVTCADPEDPCQLPFELGPDPPLEPVTADTWQAGLRLARPRVRGSVVAYWTDVHDDIFNVIDEETPTRGYFTNLERTRRAGVELSAAGIPLARVPGLTVRAALAWTRATFESEAALASPLVEEEEEGGEEPDAGEGTGAVRVQPGDRFPMVPRVTATLGVRWEGGPLVLQAEAGFTGRQYLIGDEGNDELLPQLPASTVLDFSAEWRLGARASLFAELSNVLDTEYHAFGIISENGRAAVERVERFLTPGLPRRFTAGLRVGIGGGG